MPTKADNTLPITEMGNSLLREAAQPVKAKEIGSTKINQLIKGLKQTLITKKMGVAIAAPQVGESLAISVIHVQPTKQRPKVKPFELVVINSSIIETFGRRSQLWEGCISAAKSQLFAKVPRYKKVKVRFLDEAGTQHEQIFEGLIAQIMQHEIDHLNGVLFVDRVKDPTTYMTLKEYKKQVVAKRQKQKT